VYLVIPKSNRFQRVLPQSYTLRKNFVLLEFKEVVVVGFDEKTATSQIAHTSVLLVRQKNLPTNSLLSRVVGLVLCLQH